MIPLILFGLAILVAIVMMGESVSTMKGGGVHLGKHLVAVVLVAALVIGAFASMPPEKREDMLGSGSGNAQGRIPVIDDIRYFLSGGEVGGW